MSSTTTEATSSLRHNPQLAVRLASGRQQHHDPHDAQHDEPAEVPVTRRRPVRPAIPQHPIPSMQEAFAESLAEVTSGTVAMKPKLRVDTPQVRRDRLLDQDKSEPPPEALWRMRPAQKYHELRKLLAQTAFGVYLLLKGMANSDAQVVAILQGHIDEIDDFLKTAMEDLKLATQDLNTRLDYLKLPLGNLAAFEEMLEDREFRLRIVEGNVRIEHILSRTTTALAQTIDDVAEGMRSTKEFTAYLASEENGTWRTTRPPEVADIFEAMRGNADGWLHAFIDLEEKTNTLDLLISKLADMVTDMDRCAGEVSRRTRFTIPPFTLPELTSPESEESQDSYDTTPPQSPRTGLSHVPPRLSIRFSGMSSILAPTLFGGDSEIRLGDDSHLSSLQYTPPAEASEQQLAEKLPTFSQHTPEPTQERSAPSGTASGAASVKSSATVRDADAVKDSFFDDGDSDSDTPDESTPPQQDEKEEEEEEESGEVLFMLQPQTYDPQRTSPLPSPRISEAAKSASSREGRQSSRASPQLGMESRHSNASPMSSASRGGSVSGARKASTVASLADSVSSSRTADSDPHIEHHKQVSMRERVSQRTTPPDAIQISVANAPHQQQQQRSVYAPPRNYENRASAFDPDDVEYDEIPYEHTSAYQNTGHDHYDRTLSAYETIPEDYEGASIIDDRYSTAYEAAPAVRQTGPIIREISPAGHETTPVTFFANGGRNYSQPSMLPDMVPSPYSEQQFFRPVQASPFSPLQQRPHTAASQFPSRTNHPRSTPSTMGMSMLSGVTTMTKDSKGQTVVKKKRSAFGWLKKAFTLDEEERLAYEQRKHAERQNMYQEARSPQFLDGKRIR